MHACICICIKSLCMYVLKIALALYLNNWNSYVFSMKFGISIVARGFSRSAGQPRLPFLLLLDCCFCCSFSCCHYKPLSCCFFVAFIVIIAATTYIHIYICTNPYTHTQSYESRTGELKLCHEQFCQRFKS